MVEKKEKTRCECGYEPTGLTYVERCPLCNKKIEWGKDLKKLSFN